ncbi:hypothetical protein PspLS_11624 [Pyricularia sp. CBS 133598]|nr:hypothetical protein PspLS_11624 [Pyricularia sp. CBS 133598]
MDIRTDSILLAGGKPAYGRIAAIIGISFLAYRIGLVIYRVYFHPLSKVPGPKLWAATHLAYLSKSKLLGTMVIESLELHKKYGKLVRVGPDKVIVDGSIAWPQIYQRKPNRPEFEKFPPAYGETQHFGLLASQRQDHRRQRRAVNHAFSEGALREQEPLVGKYVGQLMERLGEFAAKGEPFNISPWFDYFSLDVISDLAYADCFGTLTEEANRYRLRTIDANIRSRGYIIFGLQYPILRPFINFAFRKMLRDSQLEREVGLLKAQKRIEMGAEVPRADFMTFILRHLGLNEGKGMTEAETRYIGSTMIRAGTETTSTTMAGLFFLLGQNKQALATLVAEVRSTFQSNEDINMISTAHLPYLHGCIEEALRLYPAAAEVPPRISPGETVDGKYIPKGTFLYVEAFASNRSPSSFADPEKFAPERWLPKTHPLYNERYANDNFGAFKPFSAGPRDCIGKNLAYAELRLISSKVLWNFDFELAPGQDDWITNQRSFLVWSKGPLLAKLTCRNF